ncbi:MAG: DEAD/DEAH box helicase, partial [Chlamydiia bacterium]|nr:DEAD/DEAH box helicase [Chlamydiia bacterium]
NQTTDRVHRIGQTRGVQVFKLVTLGTFEERIDQLIATKAKLAADIITIDDYQIVKRLSRDEILTLLKPIM